MITSSLEKHYSIFKKTPSWIQNGRRKHIAHNVNCWS